MGLRKIVAYSQSHLAGPSCIYSFWHGVIPSSLHPTSVLVIFTLIVIEAEELTINCLFTSSVDSPQKHYVCDCILNSIRMMYRGIVYMYMYTYMYVYTVYKL